jgi:polysaccharide biosynthesis protein PelG
MLSTDIFVMLVFGCYCFSIMYLTVLILLYFEDRKGAMRICILFSSTSIVFSIIAKLLGDLFYGYGFFYAALISFVVALIRLNGFLKELEYRTFAAQPIYTINKSGIFSKIYYKVFKNQIILETAKK